MAKSEDKIPLEATCERMIQWLECLAGRADEQANAAREFPGYAADCRADAKNYRATAASIRKDIEEVKREGT